MSLPPPHTSSVARSLANAAASLRAHEWRSNTNTFNTYAHQPFISPRCSYWDRDDHRDAFYPELRERHRDQTHHQRAPCELYTHSDNMVSNEVVDRYTGLPGFSVSPSDVAAKRYATPYYYEVRTMEQPQTRNNLKRSAILAHTRISRPEMMYEMEEKVGPLVVEDMEREYDRTVAVVEDELPSVQKRQKKRVRYLRDTDRRNIIKRIERGEKQAALAREFGVTRAAICHIKKNRLEILSRYKMLVKSAHEMDRAETFVGPPGVEMVVHQVRTNPVLLLMTSLRDSRSSGATFRRVAGRLIMILLEEALALIGTESVEVITGTGHVYRGLELRDKYCGIAIGAQGVPFLVLFHQIEPEAPQGSIHVEAGKDKFGKRVWWLDHMDLPADIVQHKVLLFSSTCSTGDAECKAIEALCSVGCDEQSISLVCILAASDGIIAVCSRFPHVKIVTGGIDSKVDLHTETIVPGFGDFVLRYNGS